MWEREIRVPSFSLTRRAKILYKFFKEKFQIVNSFKVVSFPTESKMQIGKTTYLINSYFDKAGESLKEKIKNLLISEVQRKSEQTAT